jgi:hypothetical protein
MNNADMPAMPIQLEDFDEQGLVFEVEQFHGLSKREHFAAMALNTVLSNYNPWENGDFDSSEWEAAAKNAVGLADALLAALEAEDD